MTEIVALGDLYATKSPSVDPSKFADEVFDLFSVPAYEDRKPDRVAGAAIGSNKIAVEPGDVLICRIVPHIRRAWVVPSKGPNRQIASGEWIVLRDSRVHPEYLRQLVLGDDFHHEFMRTVAGVGGSLLRARPASAASIRIPLPPLPEQRRIASILDKVEHVRSSRLACIASLRATEDAIVELVVKQDHPKVPLRDLVQEFRYGTSVKSGSSGTPVLRIPNVSRRRLDLTDLKLVELPAVELQRLKLDDGDLLFVRSNGNPDLVGANVEVSGLQGAFVFASYLIRARMSRSVNSTYVSKFLDAKAGRSQLRSNATTSAGQYNINTKGLGAIEVPIPPLGEQVDIACKIRLVSEHRALLEAHLAKLDELFASLQYRAFRGEL